MEYNVNEHLSRSFSISKVKVDSVFLGCVTSVALQISEIIFLATMATGKTHLLQGGGKLGFECKDF